MPNLSAIQSPFLLAGFAFLVLLTLVGFSVLAIANLRSRRRVSADLKNFAAQLELNLQLVHQQGEILTRLEAVASVRDSNAGNGRAFDAAVRMARTGASTDQLTANSGISRQEARLLARLHGPAAKAQAI